MTILLRGVQIHCSREILFTFFFKIYVSGVLALWGLIGDYKDIKNLRKAILLLNFYRKKLLLYCTLLLSSKMLCCHFQETIVVAEFSELRIFMRKKEDSKNFREANSFWKLCKKAASMGLTLLLSRNFYAKSAELFIIRQLQLFTNSLKKSKEAKNPRNIVQIGRLNLRRPLI